MRLVTKIIAGSLLATGLPTTITAFASVIDPQSQRQMREGAVPVMVIFGLCSALGAWLFWNGARMQERQKQDRLLAAFFRLIKKNEGRITPLSFAAETGINGVEAKAYLDARSKEFNGGFDVDEAGNMIYNFPSRELRLGTR